ncbi:MAG: DNRLRE domain-containing protein [Candidatus Pacebacteria bacterium]|nr:DNRLRE domain-containing protein [Candidatus Paceibacterota bacterium]MBP9842554.1 DNRLRE domain-containing protein [Candidatus Paceibacterota bacterium]
MTETIVIQPGPDDGKDTYYGTAYKQSGAPNSGDMEIGGWGDWYWSFLQMDLSSLPTTTSNILSAKLKLYQNGLGTTPNNGKLERITQAWTEAGVTNTSNPAVTTLDMPWQALPMNDWWIVDITDLTKGWIDGTYVNHGVRISGQYNSGSNYPQKRFYTSDEITNASLRPKLVVEVLTQENEAPILNPIGNKIIDENQTLEFTVTADDPDSGDVLTLSATNTPPGSTFNPNTGVFSWTPGFNDAGNYTDIEFAVVDNGTPMELDVELITITVGDVNRSPEFSNPGPQEVLEGDLLTFDITATDPDGDAVSISATNTPSGASFDGTTFSWEPSLAQAGVYVVTFIATDNGMPNTMATYDVVITVGDDPTPMEQAEDLIEEVINLDIPLNVENSYLANLHKIEQFIADGKIQPAINQLNAFMNKLDQDVDHDVITQNEYYLLMEAAQNLIDALTEN